MGRTPFCILMKDASNQQLFSLRKHLVQDAQKLGIKPAARRWGISKNTVRKWLRRYETNGNKGLKDGRQGPNKIPHKTSQEVEELVIKSRKQAPCYGPRRLRYFFDLPCSLGAIQRILKEKKLVRKNKKKYQKKNDLREVKKKYKTLSRVQMDVKYLNDIPNYYGQMKSLDLPRFQYTLRDVKSGMLFLGYSVELSGLNARTMVGHFLSELKKEPALDISQTIIQTDNGAEFGGLARHFETNGFSRTIVEEYGAQHRYIPPGMCNANGDVESVHNTIEKEFFDLCTFHSKEDFFEKVETYRIFYNIARPNYSKEVRTPWWIANADWENSNIASNMSLLKTVDLDRISGLPQGGHDLSVLPVFSGNRETRVKSG